MPRHRSRESETEDVNQRRLRRGAVKRQHLTRWAVGGDELAPGVVGDTHLHPSTLQVIREEGAGVGVGQVLLVSATGQSFADGGDYVTADAVEYRHGFDGNEVAGDSVVWPVDAVGEIQVEFKWATYTGGGTIEIEVDDEVPAWGLIAEGTSGSEGCKRRAVHINEGAAVKVKVTQDSGSAQTADVMVEFSVPDPTLALGWELIDSFWVDSKVQGGASSSAVLDAGRSYKLVITGNARGIDGTFSYGAPDTILFPSPGESAEPAQADAETGYASQSDVPLPIHQNTAEFAFHINSGSGWAHVEPVGGPFTAPSEGHAYSYLVTGEGATVGARYFDEPSGFPAYDDNNGMFRVDVYRQVVA